jgi:hypothetical protein
VARIDRIVARQQGMGAKPARTKIVMGKGSFRLVVPHQPEPHEPNDQWWRGKYADLVERRRFLARKVA